MAEKNYLNFIENRTFSEDGSIVINFRKEAPLPKSLADGIVSRALLSLNYGNNARTGDFARRIIPFLKAREKFKCETVEIPSEGGLSSVAKFVDRKSGQEAILAKFIPSETDPDSSTKLEIRAMNLSYSRDLSAVYSDVFGKGN